MSQESNSSISSQGSLTDQYSSPSKKARLEYNYWSKKTPEKCEPSGVMNIKDLQLGNYRKGKIIFRVSLKSSLKLRKGSEVFNFHAINQDGEICCTAFGSHASGVYGKIQMNSVYTMENFHVRESKKVFTGLDSDVEISVARDTIILESDDTVKDIEFNFTKINLVFSNEIDVKARVDMLGIIVKDWGLETVKGKTKREITLTDHVENGIVVTMWEEEGQNFTAELYSVVAIKRAYINEYKGTRTINCGFGTLVWVNPEMQPAKDLKTWFDKNKLEDDDGSADIDNTASN